MATGLCNKTQAPSAPVAEVFLAFRAGVISEGALSAWQAVLHLAESTPQEFSIVHWGPGPGREAVVGQGTSVIQGLNSFLL